MHLSGLTFGWTQLALPSWRFDVEDSDASVEAAVQFLPIGTYGNAAGSLDFIYTARIEIEKKILTARACVLVLIVSSVR